MILSSLEVKPNPNVSYKFHIVDNPNDIIESLSSLKGAFIISEISLRESISEFLNFFQYSFGEDKMIWIAGGEENKNWKKAGEVLSELIERQVDRKSTILAIGGGVVGDFAGFVASTILRGISFVQVPTTLLAAVDSSVGGKVAVNVDKGKNMVGSFHHPEAVYFCPSVLKTLPEKEWICGLAEMAKHAYLSSDEQILRHMEEFAHEMRIPVSPAFQKAVLDSVRFKASIVSADEKESGLRAILNLGHTTAHALESLTRYLHFSHGEAVSRGMVTAIILSQTRRGLSEKDADRIFDLMKSLRLPMGTSGFTAEDVWDHMKYDKKNVAGSPRFVLLDALGKPVYGIEIERDTFKAAWQEQRSKFGEE